jgi:hypothetical protein
MPGDRLDCDRGIGRQPGPSGGNLGDLVPAGHCGTAGRQSGPLRPSAGRSAARAPALAAFTGYGDETTRKFRINQAARWQIQWAYTCPPSMRSGLLVVEDAAPNAVGASISEAGTAGRGATWLRSSARTHRLVVISTCSWTMKVWQNR